MRRSKKRRIRSITITRKLIAKVGGIGSLIAIILAVIPIVQNIQDNTHQNSYEATTQALRGQQLEVIRAMATNEDLKYSDYNIYATQTQMVQRLYEIQATATQYSLMNPYSTPTSVGSGLDVIFVIDISRSTREYRYDFLNICEKIISEITYRNLDTKIGIIVFGDDVQLIYYSDTIYDIGESLHKIEELPLDQTTSLFDGINLAYETLINEKQNFENKSLVVFTDGEDSQRFTSNIELSMFVKNQNINIIFITPKINYRTSSGLIETLEEIDLQNIDIYSFENTVPSKIVESLLN